MKQGKLLLLSVVIFAMLFAACADSSTQDGDSSQPPDPVISETVEEEVFVSIDYATDEFLSQYDSFLEFIEFEDENYQKIVFTTNVVAKDFKFIEIAYEEEDTDVTYYGSKVLYSLGELSPTKPLVVTWMEWGSIPHRGISFIDETDTTRYFYIAMSGEDGSLLLVEL